MYVEHNSLIIVFTIVILLGLFSAFFFYFVPMRIKDKNSGVIGYFVLFFLCMVFGCVMYVVRPFFPNQIATLINGILFTTGAFALRHGFVLRKDPHAKNFFYSRFYWLSIGLLCFVNVYLLHHVYSITWLRIAFINVLCSTIVLSIIPLINTSGQWTNGEKIIKYAVYFIALLFFTAPAYYLITQNLTSYILLTVVFEALALHIWLGCLCALMMSDVIQTHYKNSISDALTGIYNRRYFMQHIDQTDKERKSALIICDLDDFKHINDNFGHKNGDLAIITFARLLRDNVGEQDVVARIGGEEFAICLKDVTLNDAKNIAERLKQLTQATPLKTPDGKSITLSASFGVCTFSHTASIDDTLHKADSAMYEAKRNGKGQVSLCR